MRRALWMVILLCCGGLALLLAFKAQQQQPFKSRTEGARRHPAAVSSDGSPGDPVRTGQPLLDIQSSSAPLFTAVGQGEQRDFRSRLNAIAQLGRNLSAEERKVLCEYMRQDRQEDWLRPGQAFELKNDLLNALREQGTPPGELTDLLIELRRDSSQPLVIRDYAVQHLGSWFSRVSGEQQARIIQELEAAATESGQSYAGTALLALERIQEEHPAAPIRALSSGVQRLIEDAQGNLPARITAVQLSGRIGLTPLRESVQRLARDNSQPKTLRIAAIGALGQVGGREDAIYLSEVLVGNDPRLKAPAALALNRLNGRL